MIILKNFINFRDYYKFNFKQQKKSFLFFFFQNFKFLNHILQKQTQENNFSCNFPLSSSIFSQSKQNPQNSHTMTLNTSRNKRNKQKKLLLKEKNTARDQIMQKKPEKKGKKKGLRRRGTCKRLAVDGDGN